MNKGIPFAATLVALAAITLIAPSQAAAQRTGHARVSDRHPPPRVGRVVQALPHAHVQLAHRGRVLYYSSGIFYQRNPRGFQVIGRPHGARLKVVPSGAIRVQIGLNVFYQHGSTFFRLVGQEYEVVAPPPGATVEVLPMGYEAIEAQGEQLYVHDVVYYRFDPGRDIYLIIAPL